MTGDADGVIDGVVETMGDADRVCEGEGDGDGVVDGVVEIEGDADGVGEGETSPADASKTSTTAETPYLSPR
jgi:hypothetical protein